MLNRKQQAIKKRVARATAAAQQAGATADKVMRLSPKNMSQKQRVQFMLLNLELPTFLKAHIDRNDTPTKQLLNKAFDGMVTGQIECHIPTIQALINKVDKERWATPK